MTKINSKFKNKQNEKYITLPIMIHRQDHMWVRTQLSYIHERYRLSIAYLYSRIFFEALHEVGISEMARSNHARKVSNAWLREFVAGVLNSIPEG